MLEIATLPAELRAAMVLPERLPDGSNYEIDEGALIRVSPTNRVHGRIVTNIASYLKQKLSRDFEVLAGEVGFVLSENPLTLRAADVAVMCRTQAGTEEHDMIQGPPLLAVEVVSPSNEPADMEKKRSQYLDAGALEVWIVYPDTGTIHVFRRAEAQALIVREDGSFVSAVASLAIDVKQLFD